MLIYLIGYVTEHQLQILKGRDVYAYFDIIWSGNMCYDISNMKVLIEKNRCISRNPTCIFYTYIQI